MVLRSAALRAAGELRYYRGCKIEARLICPRFILVGRFVLTNLGVAQVFFFTPAAGKIPFFMPGRSRPAIAAKLFARSLGKVMVDERIYYEIDITCEGCPLLSI